MKYITITSDIVKVSSKKLLKEERARKILSDEQNEESAVLRVVNGFFNASEECRVDWGCYANKWAGDWMVKAFDAEEKADERYKCYSWKTCKVCTLKANNTRKEDYVVIAKELTPADVNCYWAIAKAKDVKFIERTERTVY